MDPLPAYLDAGRCRGGHQSGVEDPARYDVIRPGRRGDDLGPAGGADPQPADRCVAGDGAGHTEARQLVHGVRRDPVSAGLVPREVGGVEQQHSGVRSQLAAPQRGR